MDLRKAAQLIGLLCVIHSTAAFVSPSTFQTSFTTSNNLFAPRSSARFVSDEDTRQSADASGGSGAPKLQSASFSRVRRLRDLMWVRETQEDLTAAEFAINLDSMVPGDSKQKRKRAVDYDNLLTKLNRRILDLGCEPQQEDCQLEQIVEVVPGKGMGCIAYSDQQRDALFNRIIQTRQALMDRMKHLGTDIQEDPFSISLPEINIEILKEEESSDTAGPKLYVRDDGTVDWDGALQDQAALKNFGTAVWARINGRDPEQVKAEEEEETGTVEEGEETDTAKEVEEKKAKKEKKERPAVTAKIEETEAIRKEKELLTIRESEYTEMERDHLALLNSAISAGQAVANINFATLEAGLRRRINSSSAALELQREEVVYQRLIYELERIYTYLAGEMGNTSSSKGYIPLQDRLNVAEFGLLESQIRSFKNQIEAGEIFDADVLTVVSDQVTDFKRRLGIDYYVTGLTFDREAILKYTLELLEKTRTALAFYVKGCKLLWNDIVFASTLIIRALQGYTLKPREVRNLRRTFKDFITFIPVVIILLIPLSPVGHVLVFGAIQRVFPDFFPSCFREERQNLLQLYENAEYSELTINESFNEKIARFLEALFFQVAKIARKVYANMRGGDENSTDQ
mmetsp:Transcript_431/g.664  ORF Transcript_431/g.664 Transcript_431/m.664 type:complete len:629 (-) Transcript_431:84-1970(-)|eukprot:CAMPEP_0119019156 /NCGR_PEP_ID=MMETSP1176-20130426/21109_1 /TAXON_ID=265551 /ORGANISM="Synedropsis recta cf, Strain CCMP1620" /LENGTH=628 /DNA_ID=CAMNT_0006973299 /DNA_START=119 /DNA_END=2005 /DNA_ORIENTATION=+